MFAANSRTLFFVSVLSAGIAAQASADESDQGATADLILKDGTSAGSAEFLPSSVGVLIKLKLTGLSPGPHALHIHDSGVCDGDFESAGGIFNPFGSVHGLLNPDGPMAGDLPNIVADASGAAVVELIAPQLQISKDATESLLSEDARSIVVFEKPDDHLSEDGGAGARIACGVIVKK